MGIESGGPRAGRFDDEKQGAEDVEMVENEPEVKIAFFEDSNLDEDAHRELHEGIKNAESNPESFLGKGGAGSVYEFSPMICIKILEHREAAPDPGHTSQVEAQFQQLLHGLEVDGVRAPRVYGYWTSSEGDGHEEGIFMETMDAVNLQQALNGAEGHDVPDTFDSEKFADALENFLSEMHEAVGILHDDLYARNVMVDRVSGLPILIDFGRSRPVAGTEKKKVLDKMAEMEQFEEIAKQLKTLDK